MTYAAAHPLIFQTVAKSIAPRKPMRVSEWAEAKRILSTKGSQNAAQWRNETNPLQVEIMDCFSARSPVRDVVARLPIQFGKALALDTPIPTPGGWLTMGELRVGDWVFDDQGKPARVIGASDVFTDHPCYRVVFSDSATIIADAGHRWTVDNERYYHRRERVTLTTEEIAQTFRHGRQYCYAIPLASPLDLPDTALPIDPYVLGAWLGDGSAASGQITQHQDDAEEMADFIRRAGHDVLVRDAGPDRSWIKTLLIDPRSGTRRPTFHALLRAEGLRNNKHIPMVYLRASRAQRLALLQGMMDTDGHAPLRGHGAVEISTSYPKLLPGILDLLRGLGFKPGVRTKLTRGAPTAQISFTAYAGQQPFRLARKAGRLTGRQGRRVSETSRRRIVRVDPVETVPTRCIAVDSPSRLFLAGTHMVPTHNSEIETNILGYTMCENPMPIIVALPAEVSMNKWIDQKLNPLIEETPAIQAVLTSMSSREASNRRTFKDFHGGQLYVEHAGNPVRLKSTSAGMVLADEFSSFASLLKTGDDPAEMLDGRTSAFPSKYKRLKVGTPEIAGRCRITELYDKSDQRRYHVPCPDCGHEQPLEWSGLQWTPDGMHAWYVCRECGVVIEEHQKTAMMARGRWVAENPGARIRGYHANALYYPIGLGPRWVELVAMWRDAQGDPAKLKTFINDRLAEPWEDPSMRAVKFNIIADRAEPLPLRPVPNWVLAVTAGIDTQDNRLPVQIVGWGRGMTCWPIDYVELPGDPNEDDVWTALTALLNAPIERADGAVLRVDAALQDMLGHRTEAVKAYVRQKRVRRLVAGFGATANNAPSLGKAKLHDINYRGMVDKRGVHAYPVGTVAIKHHLFAMLSTDADKPAEERKVRFSDELSREYFGGLVSETYDPRKNRFEKIRGTPRNEPLDTWVYAYAAALHPELRLHRWTKANWDVREAQVLASIQRPAANDDSRETPAPAARAAPRPQDSRGTRPRPRGFDAKDGWSL